MSEWLLTTIGAFAPFRYGKGLTERDRNSSGAVPVYGSNGIVGTHDTPLIPTDGIIVGRKGTVGVVHYSPVPFFAIDTTFYIEPSPSRDLRFTYYLLQTLGLESRNSDSAVPGLNREAAHALEIRVPPLPVQRRIAHILGTLDDKIEHNRRVNATLEAIARALFTSWFVDFDPVRAKADGRTPAGMSAELAALFPATFEDSPLGKIPSGWGVGRLDDLVDFVIGGDWGKDTSIDDIDTTALCIRGADIPNLQAGGVGNMPLRYLKRSSLEKRSLVAGDIVIEISGGSPTQSTGRPVLITEELLSRLEHPLVCSNFCRMIRLKMPSLSNFIYLWLRLLYSTDEFLQYENGTTGIKNFAFTVFNQQHPLLIPPDAVIEAFNQQVAIFVRSQQAKGIQSETLAALRDALLPRLLSGEVAVGDGGM